MYGFGFRFRATVAVGAQASKRRSWRLGVLIGAMDSRKRCFDDISRDDPAPHWADVKLLYEAASALGLPSLEGRVFHVELDGRASFRDNRWLLSGHLLASWMRNKAWEDKCGPKVVVSVSEAIYSSVVAHSKVIRILQANLSSDQGLPIIDTCTGHAVVASTSHLQRSETIEIAELFCGGFNGWSQGVKVLRSFGYQCRTRWLLDTAPECFEGSRQVNPGLQAIYDQEQLLEHCPSQDPGFLCANLESPWWLQALAITGPQIVCVSAPCQPWSVGGLGSGLDSEDGRLLLHVFGQMAFLQPPVIVLEQVHGFRTHPHSVQVQQAWIEAGYREAWSSVLDMVDVAPTSRKRYLLVLLRVDLEGAPALQFEWPVLPRRPTLGTFDCVLNLPSHMHKDCLLDEATLAKYLDPWFLPPPQHRQHRAQSPQAFRYRGLADRASCFVAQYHYQHELSDRMLERAGLFGILLELPHEVRFFSGAEVALIHGTVSPLWLPRDDRVQMRLMGNAISVFHAVVPLTLAFQAVGPRALHVSTAQAILQGMSMRIKASEARILDLQEGWVLCRSGAALQSFIEAHHTWVPRQQLPDPCLRFQRFVCVGRAEHCHLVVSPAVSLPVLLALLGHEFPDEAYAQLQLESVPLDLAITRNFEPPAEAQLDLEVLPSLPLLQGPARPAAHQDLLFVIGKQAYYALHRGGPLFFWEMAQTMAMEGWRQADFFETDDWFSFEGHRILCKADLQGTVQFRVVDCLEDLPWHVSLEQLACFKVLSAAGPPRVRISGPSTVQLCSEFPVRLFAAWGWVVQLLPCISRAQVQADIVFLPGQDRLRIPEAQVLQRLSWQVFAGLLRVIERVACDDAAPTVACKVQVQGTTFWFGHLPADLSFQDISELWSQATIALGVPQPHRMYSGPRFLPDVLSLAAATTGPKPQGFINSGGWLLVTIMPETRGGGAKDAKFRDAQKDLAQLLLDRGVALNPATGIVDKLLSAAGVARVQRALDLTEATNRWLQIQDLARQFAVSIPESTPTTEKAFASTAAEAARRRSRAEAKVCASDFVLLPGFFKNADGTAATVLKQLMPGASGVFLCDGGEAPRLLSTWAGTCSGELGLVVLGHSCPDASTCQGRCGVPASTLTGNQVLLHACWHSLGRSPLHIKCDNDASITLPEAACVSVTVHKDEFSSQEWQGLVTNPVRAVADRLRSRGSTVVLESPWGRSFRKDNKPGAASDCSSVQFHCRIQNSDLLQLLRVSGHSGVYITPKTWQGDIAKGYAIVWTTGDQEEAKRLSLQVADPLGIVRSKKRYGIRVAEANYEATWAVVRPGDASAPPKVDVTGLYKLLSAPPQLRSADIQDWAKQMGWTVRPLRCLSPGQWLLGSNGPPPTGLLSINQQAVLVQAVAPRSSDKPIVQAGRAPKASSAAAVVPDVEDPLALNDPWRSYLSSVGRAPAPSGQQRAPEAPHQQRYDQQETRLQKLEAGLDEVRRGHTAMAQQLSSTQTIVEAQVEQVKGDLSSLCLCPRLPAAAAIQCGGPKASTGCTPEPNVGRFR